MAKTVSWDSALFLAFFSVFFCVARLPVRSVQDAKSCRKEEGANCRYTRQGLTNLRVNKLRV